MSMGGHGTLEAPERARGGLGTKVSPHPVREPPTVVLEFPTDTGCLTAVPAY